jgi:hypothetical protein
MTKDSNNKELKQGQKAYFRPDLDATEEMFGNVPDELAGDVCTVEEIDRNPSKVKVSFEGYTKPFTVHANALVGIAQAEPLAE